MMKKTLNLIAALVLITSACTSNTSPSMNSEPAYIGPAAAPQASVLTEDVMLTLGRLSDPQPSSDGKKVLYGVSYTDVATNRSCRNLFILDLETEQKTQISFEGRSLSNERWGGRGIVYIQGGQIWTAEIGKSGIKNAVQLSNVAEGISEFSISPDGSKIMYISTVKSHVDTPKDVYEDLPLANAYSSETLMYRHWDHFVERIPHTFVANFSLEAGCITEASSVDILAGEDGLYELPTEPFGGIEQLCWTPDSKSIVYSCRKLEGREYAFSTNSCIYLYDIETASCRNLSYGGGYDTDPAVSPDGQWLTYLSMERDGYEADKVRLMLLPLNLESTMDRALTFDVRDLTYDFDYNAAEPVWASDSRGIYFNSLVDGLQGIFKVDIESGEISRLTDSSLWNDFHTPFIAGEDGTMYATYASMSFPTEIARISRSGRSARNVSHENDHILEGLSDVSYVPWRVPTVDGKEMLVWAVLPPDFDPDKEYPAIEIFLGGPQGTLSQSWSYRWNYRLMASHGYIVILPNRRGTTAFGQQWCEQISGDYPGLNMSDYLSAAEYARKTLKISKIAGCGASYGGYSVYNMCGIHGDTFDCFIAHAGIFNQEHMYMSTEEMWFPNFDNGGLHEFETDPEHPLGPKGDGQTFGGIRQGGSPWSDKPEAVRHYAESPHKKVQKWHTPILVIHGGSDFRVPVEQGMAAFNAAQMMGVESKIIIFPDENHWILKPQNALFWHREFFSWLDSHCK